MGRKRRLVQDRPDSKNAHLQDKVCPLCLRSLVVGPSTDRHHFIPRSRGGKDAVMVHRVCHRQVHALWSEQLLERQFNTAESIRSAPEFQPFLRFISRKSPEYYVRTSRKRS